jgi:predicted  nucleic acid-binding Zn-ribbon protein
MPTAKYQMPNAKCAIAFILLPTYLDPRFRTPKTTTRMEQDLLKTNLSGLERKLLVLLNEHKSLKEQVKTLKSENQTLRDSVRVRDEQLDNFTNQIKISKIVDRLNPEDGQPSELKKKVDEYIREIDQCIAHLSQ